MKETWCLFPMFVDFLRASEGRGKRKDINQNRMKEICRLLSRFVDSWTPYEHPKVEKNARLQSECYERVLVFAPKS